ncbi:MAG: hypothetical protein H0Z32_04685 [Bacillaceae bacterium]|nr:hypothetical protein [Bacillaceae bacterium]
MKKKLLATSLLVGGLFIFSLGGLNPFAADEGNVGGINSIGDLNYIAADEGNVGGINSIHLGDL